MKERDRPADQDLELRAGLFKALGHPTRLLMLNLIHVKPRHVEELAEILLLSPATVSHHLSKLSEVGLLHSEKDQYYQTYSLVGDLLGRSLAEMVFFTQPELGAAVQEDAYTQKVLATFLQRGRLIRIPAQRKKRQIILEKLVQEFEPDRTYSEREVNQILVEFHDDVATLRREMIGCGLMQRDNGIYWRVVAAPTG